MSPAQAAAILVVPSLVTNVWQALAGGGLARACTPPVADARAEFASALSSVPCCCRMMIRDARLSGLELPWRSMQHSASSKYNFKVPRHAETWLGLVMGAATGAITVATGIFVIPGTPYVQALQFERDKLVQALGLSFTVSTITLAAGARTRRTKYAGSLAGPSLLALGARARGHGSGAIGAWPRAGGNLPVVVFYRATAARRPSGAARTSCDRLSASEYPPSGIV